jgi:type I restriction enzyme S subunit
MHARIGWQNLRTSEFLDSGEYMLITGTDFQDGKIDYSKVHYVEKERYEQDKKIQISNGSILITKDGTIGKVAYVENLPMKSTLNAGVFNLTVVDDINTSNLYLYHYLKGPFLLRFVNEESTGGTIKHLNQNVLVKFPIPLPSYREQLKISVFLTNIDKLITLHQRKELLEYSFFAKLFIIPLHKSLTNAWEQRKLGEHSQILAGGTPKTQIKEYWEPKEIPWMSSGEINKKRLFSTDNQISKLGFENSSARWVKENSVLIALAGQGKTRGTVAINEIPLTTNQSIAAIEPDDKLDSEFLFQNLEKRYEELRLASSGDGSRGGLNKQIISDIKIIAPSVKEQSKIGLFFKHLDDTIALHQRTHFSIQY